LREADGGMSDGVTAWPNIYAVSLCHSNFLESLFSQTLTHIIGSGNSSDKRMVAQPNSFRP
jgi:hypothetical protein